MKDQQKKYFKNTIVGGFHFTLDFLKNPLGVMKKLPEIPLGEAILVQACLSILTGVLMAFVSKSFFTLFWGIFIYPVVSILVCGLTSMIVFYGISYFSKTSFDFHKVYVAVFLASIPAYLIRIAQPILPSVDLVGLAISSILLKTALVNNFELDKKTAAKVVVILYSILLLGFLINWLGNWNQMGDLGFKISL